jgi:acyl carrier protein phosphodiesterase
MISDYVKGRKKLDYPAGVQKGIMLHRAIDEYTDTHAATKEAKAVFRPTYRLYSGAFVDVVYDHFLANDPGIFHNDGLMAFSLRVYDQLDLSTGLFPEKFALLFPHMKKHNWLYHYHTRQGAEKSLGGVVHRSLYLTESATAFRLFEQHYQLLQDCYRHFWADALPFIRQKFDELQIQL